MTEVGTAGASATPSSKSSSPQESARPADNTQSQRTGQAPDQSNRQTRSAAVSDDQIESDRLLREIAAGLIGMEACATSHYWARELGALGHTVRQKHDAADAGVICEAVSRPSVRFVPLKRAEQQGGVLVLHRTRDLLIRQRTMLANALRASGNLRRRNLSPARS